MYIMITECFILCFIRTGKKTSKYKSIMNYHHLKINHLNVLVKAYGG